MYIFTKGTKKVYFFVLFFWYGEGKNQMLNPNLPNILSDHGIYNHH